ncbi:MAG: hypothetical protein LUD68_07545 [Rikenellaceae bacterium]|nr:hypothetical protein [Rikenellaceae bacterium]
MSILVDFAAIFLASRFFFKQFVIYKIKPIYRLATRKSISSKEMKNRLYGKEDLMDEIREELSTWSEKREYELAELRDTERFKKDYIENVSHEIKTPIFTIQGYLMTLLDGALEDPEVNRLYLERAAKNIDRLAHILTDLDVINKMESGQGELQMTVFDIKALIWDVFATFEFEADKKESG